ncbi:hypothetical protein AKJ09_00298 [Labilithrix luteola]|uniref:TolB protein n=1 Tax=Labilithrix luteola TaxID=1391654 RepID=A0A0K1PKJ7_9BACT|nr:hypothetical protein AKJ09_00298 [Labilithrix luteola]
MLTLSESRNKLYLGQTAKLDGASIAPNITANAKWVVLAAPSDSAIKTESLQGADTTSPSFKPDVLGQYTLQVSDGVSSSVLVLIEAIDVPVFWRETTFSTPNDGAAVLTAAIATHVGGVYGARDRVIDCPVTSTDDPGRMTFAYSIAAAHVASWGDTWEAPPGQPSRVVVPAVNLDPAHSLTKFSLLAATSQSACSSPDARTLASLDTDAGVPMSGDIPTSEWVWNARFSPDGNRVAFMSDNHGIGRLATIGFDGSGKRELAPTQAEADGGALDPDAATNARVQGGAPLGPLTPRWKDNAHIGWITFHGPTATSNLPMDWELYVVEDKDGAQPELAMRCSNVSPQTFDFLPDGSIVLAGTHEINLDAGTASPTDLLVYKANANKDCELVRNLTNSKTDSDWARDLALSPDKTQVAFLSGTGQGAIFGNNYSLSLATVPVDGSRAPAVVPGAEGGAAPGVGPRWVAGGTALTWGRVVMGAGIFSGIPGGVGGQAAIPVEGGTPRILAEGSSSQTPDGPMHGRIISGIGQGCSVGRGALSSGFMAGSVALGLASLIARRRRRSN